jgi:hypothetical protein
MSVPILKILSLPLTVQGRLPSKRRRLLYALLSTPYEIFKVSIGRIAHLKWLMRDRKWNVTPRKSTAAGADATAAPTTGIAAQA